MCKALLEEFRVEGSMYQMGRTRVFFRAGVLGHLEDTWARIQRSSPCKQAHMPLHTCPALPQQQATLGNQWLFESQLVGSSSQSESLASLFLPPATSMFVFSP